MLIPKAEEDDERGDILALRALAWVLADMGRADRFVALTGIAPDDLRARAGTPAVMDAVLGFLEGHQPDLVACAAELGVPAIELVAARQRLSR